MNIKDIFTFHNLYNAHLKTRRGKLYKNEVALFDLNKANELFSLEESFIKNTYQISPYRTFYIFEPKKRRVDATSYKDRVVQNCFVDNYLFPLLENHLIYDNGACRKNKGTDFARNRLKSFLLEAYKKYGNKFYVLSFDVHHYFESIDHDVLKAKLRKLIKEDDIYSFATMVIDSFSIEDNKGIPLGNQSSQCFALYYLDHLDRIIKERFQIKYYSRYMDDGVIISNDKNKLMKLLNALKEEIKDIKLQFNLDKTFIYSIKQGVTYLGFRYKFTSTGRLIVTMARKKKKRLIRHLNRHEYDIDTLMCYHNYLLLRSNNRTLIKNLRYRVYQYIKDNHLSNEDNPFVIKRRKRLVYLYYQRKYSKRHRLVNVQ